MEDDQKMSKLLQRFIVNECNAEEIEAVADYFKRNKITAEFPTVDEVVQHLNEAPAFDKLAADRIFSEIIAADKSKVVSIRLRKTRKKTYLAIAAMLVVFLSLGIVFNNSFQNDKPAMVLTGSEITLQLENGDIQVIASDGTSTIIDADGNIIGSQTGNTLTYNATDSEKLTYNTLKIPYGKRFKIQLSDGTLVHLNAGTTLKYPIKFLNGQSRQVFLDGEAYFEVAKDKAHPFLVNADKLNVRVLGTVFNVTHYPEDDATDVVLVEGSVGMYDGAAFDAKTDMVLQPGSKGSFDKVTGKIVAKRVDASIYTSWIDGRLTFKNMTFNTIKKKLERHYDVSIVNTDKRLDTEKFNASFGNQPIEKVLSYFSEIHAFNYTVKGKEIIIQ